jgi:hypothetical protein
VLSDADKALYARQILLSELGLPGQERLASTAVRIADGADARVSAVTRDYLARAGVGSQPDAIDLQARVVNAASASDVSRVAGDAELEGCAAWLLGAFAAVEAIKAAAGVGAPSALDADFVLAREVV